MSRRRAQVATALLTILAVIAGYLAFQADLLLGVILLLVFAPTVLVNLFWMHRTEYHLVRFATTDFWGLVRSILLLSIAAPAAVFGVLFWSAREWPLACIALLVYVLLVYFSLRSTWRLNQSHYSRLQSESVDSSKDVNRPENVRPHLVRMFAATVLSISFVAACVFLVSRQMLMLGAVSALAAGACSFWVMRIALDVSGQAPKKGHREAAS